MANVKELIKRISPPILVDAGRWMSRGLSSHTSKQLEWEYVPEGWRRAENDPQIKGWNVPGVLEAYKRKWPAFVESLDGTGPLGVSHEADRLDGSNWSFHNTIMCFAYVLAMASRNKDTVSILDSGGGIGHYYLISKSLLPGVTVDYHCRDLPILAEHGRSLFPEAHFYDDDSYLSRRYDLVVSSSSLQYAQDWAKLLGQLAEAASGYLYVTRIPVVSNTPSFVVLQRAYSYGYGTEYLGWFFNREELVRVASDAGVNLVREFVLGEGSHVRGAPENAQHRGFLFQPVS